MFTLISSTTKITIEIHPFMAVELTSMSIFTSNKRIRPNAPVSSDIINVGFSKTSCKLATG